MSALIFACVAVLFCASTTVRADRSESQIRSDFLRALNANVPGVISRANGEASGVSNARFTLNSGASTYFQDNAKRGVTSELRADYQWQIENKLSLYGKDLSCGQPQAYVVQNHQAVAANALIYRFSTNDRNAMTYDEAIANYAPGTFGPYENDKFILYALRNNFRSVAIAFDNKVWNDNKPIIGTDDSTVQYVLYAFTRGGGTSTLTCLSAATLVPVMVPSAALVGEGEEDGDGDVIDVALGDVQVGNLVRTANGFERVEFFVHRDLADESSCVRLCKHAEPNTEATDDNGDCVVVSNTHFVALDDETAAEGRRFEQAQHPAVLGEFAVRTTQCEGIVSLHVASGSIMTSSGIEVSCYAGPLAHCNCVAEEHCGRPRRSAAHSAIDRSVCIFCCG